MLVAASEYNYYNKNNCNIVAPRKNTSNNTTIKKTSSTDIYKNDVEVVIVIHNQIYKSINLFAYAQT